MCGLVYHPKYLEYDLGAQHPFSPLRIKMVTELLEELGHELNYELPELIPPEKLQTVHDTEYIEVVELAGMGVNDERFEKYGLGTADNPVKTGMSEAARYICGGTLHGAKLMLDGKYKKVLQLGGGFHHAHENLASGFCLYNDLALAITEMINRGWHVVYLDIDVHHGDGLQKMFYEDDRVMTISLHESGEYLFPGTGWIYESGRGMGKSLKLNLPFEPFTEGKSYVEILEELLELALGYFRPDALIVQAGADAHFTDPLADLMLTTHDYERIFKTIIRKSEKYANGRLLFTFGGGYSFEATARIWSLLYLVLTNSNIPEKLPGAWIKKWEEGLGVKIKDTFHDTNPFYKPIPRKNEIENHNKDTFRRLLDIVTPDWL